MDKPFIPHIINRNFVFKWIRMNSKVDFYFKKEGKWQAEINRLRKLILDCGLQEELKWGAPCYCYKKANVVLIHVFKDYCGVLFFKGALIANENQLLVKQTAQVQAARQARFTSMKEIDLYGKELTACIFEAVEVEKAGLKVKMKTTEEFEVPAEFSEKLKQSAALKSAFSTLTPGRQRAYLLYFADAKQAKTRAARIEKYIPKILRGKGMMD